MKRIAHGDRRVNRSPVPSAHQSADGLDRPGSRTDRLLAANERLLMLRAQRAAQPVKLSPPVTQSAPLPSHLGWGNQRLLSKPATPTAPKQQTCLSAIAAAIAEPKSEASNEQQFDPTYVPKLAQTVSIYPTVATAILKAEQAASARIWLLCRHLDHAGRGWLPVAQLRDQLTKATVNLKVVGWRRLRQLLTSGQGVFWERRRTSHGEDRVWLFGWRRVCHALEITRLADQRVELPLGKLLGPIGMVRAALYTAFHTGRPTNPISRQTLSELSGISERSQRTYDKRCAVDSRPNYAIGASFSAEDQRTRTFESTTPHFIFTDYKGVWGAVGKQYTARQLPNSYQTNWQRSHSAQKRKLNQRLKQDLVKHGTQGNSNSYQRWERIFVDGMRNAKRLSNGGQYLRDHSNAHNGRDQFWMTIDPIQPRTANVRRNRPVALQNRPIKGSTN